MQNTPIWKPIVIVLVLVICGLSLYPPNQKLKPGLDLAGGTTLVYQVDVPDDQDPTSVVDQVIETLKKRVDPNGVKNLSWRRQAGSRIEIQVPLPPPETSRRRTIYLQQLEALLAGNIKKSDLASTLRLDASHRPAAFDRLAGNDKERRQMLDQLAVTHDALADATGPYRTAQQRVDELREKLEGLPADSGAGQRDALNANLTSADTELVAKTRQFVDARNAFDAAQEMVLASNVDPVELDRVLNLPLESAAAPQPSQANRGTPVVDRQAALEVLIARHSGLTDQLRAVAEAKILYDEVRDTLDDPNDLIAMLRGSGVLEFRIAAPSNLPDAQTFLDQLAKRGPRTGSGKAYRWFMVDDPEQFADNPRELDALEADPVRYFNSRGQVGQAYGSDYYILLANTPNQSLTRSQQDWKLTNAYSLPDDSGFRAVGFELNRVGGQLMGSLTGNNQGKPMAIVLDGRVMSTPSINAKIQDKGIITGGRGGFSDPEQRYLIRTLNAGSLQGRISEDPIYIKTFGPQLGQDNLRRGKSAAVWALVAVAVFMAVYYLLMGLVADFALAANMVIILGLMASFGANFTLPGIAGIVLTIGMAVDANVLIFERIREELNRKADVKTAVRLGYDKALSTIIDANLTTLITCVVLFYTATEEIKGFALTLMIGIMATMFTALFCTRVIVDFWIDVSKPNKIVMLPTMMTSVRHLLQPKVDWVAKRYVLFGFSAVFLVVGFYVIYQRGQDLLDIEFRSGTQVGFQLADDQALALDQVRNRLSRAAEESQLPLLAGNLATVVTVGDVKGTEASEFSVSTLETDTAAVSEAIKTAFADVLDIQRPVKFAQMGTGHQTPPVNQAPVYVIRTDELGDSINRPLVRQDASDHIGGVAVVIDDMNPPQSISQLTDRIGRMRLQPAYESLGYHPYTVIGLDLAPSENQDEPLYRSVVMLASQEGTNYVDTPESFTASSGFAYSQWQLVRDALRRDTSLGSVAKFSSQISRTMKLEAIRALVLSLLAIVLYIWFRFGSLAYGLAAIAALVHDVVITLGLVAIAGLGLVYATPFGQALLLSDFKINFALVAAMLTIVGYSLNDTIVIFDRIRENRGRLASVTPGIINDSINQTISRTLVTSLTTILAVGTLYVFGGDGVHGFAFAMLIGVFVGTYSSVAIAAPLLLIGVATTTKQKASDSQAGEKAIV